MTKGGLAGTACVAALLAGGSSALAAGVAPAGPVLVTPATNARVAPGKITLLVRDPSPLAAKYGVFAQIAPQRKLKGGQLQNCSVQKGCDFVALRAVKGRKGYFSFVATAGGFPGWWTTTPARYLWQAHHIDCTVKGCDVFSRIGTFRVTAK